jgi:hypothetical protein
MFFSKKKTEIMTGKAKPMEEVTLEDMQINPIGIFALDEEGNEGQDETWLKPLLHTTDVTQDLVESYILLKVKNSDVYSSACLDIKRMKLNDMSPLRKVSDFLFSIQ